MLRSITKVTLTNTEDLFSNWSGSTSSSTNSNTNSEANMIISNDNKFMNDNLSLSAIGSELNGKFNAINTFTNKTLVRSAYEWNEKERIDNITTNN